jgi:hypothetical protein
VLFRSTVTIRLHNNLDVPTGLLFQGQAMAPDITGVAPLGTGTYTFTAGAPGTYLYEAAPLKASHNHQHQVAMGLHGALIVRPATAGQAYADAATAFDREALLVLSEVDPALNNATDPAAFDMRSFAPRYFLINGKPYPDTAALPVQPGHKLLLRYVNAGAKHHAMATLGLRQNFIAKDGSPLPQFNHNVAAETLAPGQTADALVQVPATAAPGSRYALYDANLLNLRNSSQPGFGGMMSFVAVEGTAVSADTQGPATSALAVSGTGNVTATVSDVGLGGNDITAAEYFLDTITGTARPMTVTPTATTGLATVSATLDPFPSGTHTVYVRGQDAAGNWGSLQAKVYVLDNVGPITSALSVSPSLTNGSTDVTLRATANDSATGGSNIAAVAYSVDGGTTYQPMSFGPTGSKVVSATAVIPAAVVNGLNNGTGNLSVPITVRSTDTAGNLGGPATISLQVNKAGAVTSGVTVSPSPNNGTRGLSASQPVVRVTAQVASVQVAAAEGYIVDANGKVGGTFPFSPSDGAFNGTSEAVFADIPLSSVALLPAGTAKVFVRGKDGGGTWGSAASGDLVIDKQAPTVNALTPASSTIAAGSPLTLNVAVNDASAVNGQYWVDGSATPPTSPKPFTGTSPIVTGLTGGTHTVYVRMRDEATNWSNVVSVTVQVVQAVNDTRAVTAGGGATQTTNVSSGGGLLANDLPVALAASRTASLATVPVRTAGTGSGTLTVSCPASLGTPAAPSGQSICTNGAYRITLNGVGNTNNARRLSKLGSYSFTYTYTDTASSVSSTGTVIVTVN